MNRCVNRWCVVSDPGGSTVGVLVDAFVPAGEVARVQWWIRNLSATDVSRHVARCWTGQAVRDCIQGSAAVEVATEALSAAAVSKGGGIFCGLDSKLTMSTSMVVSNAVDDDEEYRRTEHVPTFRNVCVILLPFPTSSPSIDHE